MLRRGVGEKGMHSRGSCKTQRLSGINCRIKGKNRWKWAAIAGKIKVPKT